MYRIFLSEKDTYITDRVINSGRSYQSNMGRAGTLDVFKLYGVTQSGSFSNIELSRALIKFDYSSLSASLSASHRSVSDPTFNVQLKLYDVYGGQTTPSGFNLVVYPLSRSFDEGTGRDVGLYRDQDTANFLTASWNGNAVPWFVSGANGKGFLGSNNIDIITSGSFGAGIIPMGISQSFVKGTEDLTLDITKLVSATMVGLLPDYGFRISFITTEENDTRSRFVKRFASRSAADKSLRPKLLVRWDDTVQDDRNSLMFDTSGTIRIYNHTPAGLTNLTAGNALVPVTGANCIRVRLETPIVGGIYSATFVGSQMQSGNAYIDGAYYASIAFPSSDPDLGPQLAKSGSLKFNEYWTSVDGTVGFSTSSLTIGSRDVQSYGIVPIQHFVNVINAKDLYSTDEIAQLRVFVRRIDGQYTLKKLPSEAQCYIPGATYYRIRDFNTGDIVIPFDETYNSTRLNADSMGLAFTVYMDAFSNGSVYTIDIMIKEGSVKSIYRDVCSPFRIEEPH